MLSQFFQAQYQNPVKGDWTITVVKNLQDLKLDMYNFETIRNMKKEKFK